MERLIFNPSKWTLIQERLASGERLPDKNDTPAEKWNDEVFARLYDGDQPEVPPEESTVDPKWSKWSRKFHTIAEQNPDWKSLQHDCVGDLLKSLAASEAVYAAMKEMVEQEDPDPPPGGSGAGEGEGQGDGQGQGQGGQSPSDSAMRKKVAEALKDAQKQADDAGDTAGAFGPGAGTGMGSDAGKLNPQQVKQMMEVLKRAPHLKRIATLAGRFRRIAENTRKTQVKHANDEVMDVEVGNDLSRVLPQSLAGLVGTEEQRLAFLADFAAGKLPQYRIGGRQSKGLGPIVVCLDKSGSMAGNPDEWATSIALAILSMAQRDRRPFVLMPYKSGPVHREGLLPAHVAPGEPIPMDALLERANGGTNVDLTLKEALGIIEKAAAERGVMAKADIILMSDGDCWAENSVKERADALDCKILGIGIGIPAETLKPWCHEAIGVEDLSTVQEDLAVSLFAERQ